MHIMQGATPNDWVHKYRLCHVSCVQEQSILSPLHQLFGSIPHRIILIPVRCQQVLHGISKMRTKFQVSIRYVLQQMEF